MSYLASASVTRRSWRLEKLDQSIRSSANQVAAPSPARTRTRDGPQDDQGLTAGITDRVGRFPGIPGAASMYRVAGSCAFTGSTTM